MLIVLVTAATLVVENALVVDNVSLRATGSIVMHCAVSFLAET